MVVEINNRFMPVLKKEELDQIREVLDEKIHSLIHSDTALSDDDAWNLINDEINRLSSLRSKLSGAYIAD